jgi:5-methylcytosine-specific restriction enzyme A
LTPCAEPTCPELTRDSRCPKHRRRYPHHDQRSNERYGNPHYRKNRAKALERDGYRCRFKGCGSTNNLSVHHVIAIRDGGTNQVSNLVTLCRTHHEFMEKVSRGGVAP